MNHLIPLVFVISLCVGSNNAGLFFAKNQMYFKNSFTKNSDLLTVHCKSEKDDLGIHILHHFYIYDFKFGDELFGGTKFVCMLTHEGVGFKYSRTFTAYMQSPYFMRFGVKYFWDARDDGIYLADDTHTSKLRFGWNVTILQTY
ncbi:hypothetical protein CARUB_v10015524mg [Capsella rubella]|uniref:S-protein homolog n=1 Tax=Capsella rubella TaxID=81985 RepID=R0HR48_9BRAS|nr:hypothetical protein CARUB_v10015524mg [Capsella rubella]